MKILLVRIAFRVLIFGLFVASNDIIGSVLLGNLSTSLFFGINLSDPFAIIQLFLAGFSVSFTLLSAALIVLVFYAFIAPRAFCGWVCPVGLISEFAYFLRRKFGLFKQGKILNIEPKFKYYFLFASLIASFVFGILAFESISFVGIIQRGIIFGHLSAILIAFMLFLFDLVICEKGICGKICPIGAFYAIISKFSLIRIFHKSSNCTKCMDCVKVCPQVDLLKMVGKSDKFIGSECISCAKCVEICAHSAMKFTIFRRNV